MEAHFAEQALFNLNLIRFRYRLIETIVYQKCMLAFLTSFRIWNNCRLKPRFLYLLKCLKKCFLECQVFGLSKDSFGISSSYLEFDR